MFRDLYNSIHEKSEAIIHDGELTPKNLAKAFAYGSVEGAMNSFVILGVMTFVVSVVYLISLPFQSKK